MSDDPSPDEPVPPQVADAARHLPLPLVPPEASRRSRELFHVARPLVDAELVTDTRGEGTLVGARGGASSAWSMSYRAGDCDIVLDLALRRATIQLNGQLLCPEPTPDGVLRVFRSDLLVTSGSTDEFGQFELGELPPDTYTISVTRPDCVIEIPVDLSEPSLT